MTVTGSTYCNGSTQVGPVELGNIPVTCSKPQKYHCHRLFGLGDFTCFTATTFLSCFLHPAIWSFAVIYTLSCIFPTTAYIVPALDCCYCYCFNSLHACWLHDLPECCWAHFSQCQSQHSSHLLSVVWPRAGWVVRFWEVLWYEVVWWGMARCGEVLWNDAWYGESGVVGRWGMMRCGEVWFYFF